MSLSYVYIYVQPRSRIDLKMHVGQQQLTHTLCETATKTFLRKVQNYQSIPEKVTFSPPLKKSNLQPKKVAFSPQKSHPQPKKLTSPPKSNLPPKK